MAADTLKSTPGARGASGTSGLRRLLLDNGALTALIVLVVAMSVLSGDFLTADNLLNIGVQAAVTAILAGKRCGLSSSMSQVTSIQRSGSSSNAFSALAWIG